MDYIPVHSQSELTEVAYEILARAMSNTILELDLAQARLQPVIEKMANTPLNDIPRLQEQLRQLMVFAVRGSVEFSIHKKE